MSSQHIGSAGELLVQYQLLKLEIDSARLTVDAGVDLVVYSPGTGAATTVQVKTAREAKPAGGKGKIAVGWNFPHELGAQMLAVTMLATDQVWIFTADEARALAMQHTEETGIRRIYLYVDEQVKQRPDGFPLKLGDMEPYLLEHRAPQLFPR